MTWEELALFLSAGVVGGVVNALAGGAKLFVFPILLASGLPPIMANATGTVALWPAQLPALLLHRRLVAGDGQGLLLRIWPALVGALVGAGLLIVASERAFLTVIPFVLVAAVAVIAFGDRTATLASRVLPDRHRAPAAGVLLFLSGVYGGFFGAGMGFLLIAVLTLSGVASIHVANAEKNAVATAINTTAVAPLLLSGLVHLPAAGVVLLGGLVGGLLGGLLAGRLPEAPMRIGVALLGTVLTLSFLFS
ncbi:sulfite exporter TauE/SafE family protein [Rubrimonas sp.]|uniref:sulfite exporter TauE/SafE family protein n=1 Tax=Rubrimonas sp. TaxID=2036015 RepID=UPI002FDE5028